jgi:thiol-disulfide isomerase/thioredoxin
MKPALVAVALLGLTNACQNASAAEGYQITGQLRNLPAGTTLHLSELTSSQFVERGTAKTDAQGRFTFKGTLPVNAAVYQLKVDEPNQVLLVLDNKTHLTLSGDAKSLPTTYSVKGSKDSEVIQQLTRTMNASRDQMQRLAQRYNAAGQAGHTDSLAAIEQQYNVLQRGTANRAKSVIRHNATSVAAGFATLSFVNPDDDFAFADSIATVQRKAQPASPFTQALTERLAPLRATAIGTEAPEINLAQPDGKPLSLKSLRGKYVLVDFWASWCGPCRQENPNVVKAYEQFKGQGKGFTIYSVSLDQKKENWEKAIAADHLVWPNHVSDLKFWQSAAAAAYGVQAIPQSFLLDPNGKIIAKNLRGPALEAKLAEVLK